MTRALAALVLLLLTAPATLAQTADRPAKPEPRPGELRSTTQRAVIFKDGYTLVIKSLEGAADDTGAVFLDEVPDAAVLGTFWVTPAEGAKVDVRAVRAERIRAEREEEKLETCSSIQDLLRANLGREVFLNRTTGPAVRCRIAEILERETPDPELQTNSPHAMNVRYASGFAPDTNEPARLVTILGRPPIEYIVVESIEGMRDAIPLADIRGLSSKDLNTKIPVRSRIVEQAKRLTVDLASGGAAREGSDGRPLAKGAPVKLTLAYFTPGIRWIPTYRVTGDLVTDATISLQGEILNELEDFANVPVDLIVGVPTFRFKDAISPMALEMNMRNALLEAAPNLMGARNDITQVMFQQRAGEYTTRRDAAPGGDVPALPGELAEGGGEQDLFVYPLGPTSLKKGARATIPLWSTIAPVKHLYTLEMVVLRTEGGSATSATPINPPGTPGSPMRVTPNRVWHQLELTNRSAYPWTTGPAMLLKGNLPLGQDLMTYTPIGACTLLPVTIVPAITAVFSEQEQERKLNALNWDSDHYALVTKKGQLRIKNQRDQAAPMRISLSIGGKVTAASDGGVITINDYQDADWNQQRRLNYLPNNHSDVAWEFTLAAGETRTLNVDFGLYVR